METEEYKQHYNRCMTKNKLPDTKQLIFKNSTYKVLQVHYGKISPQADVPQVHPKFEL
jgi:hypothetical protein